MQPTKTQRVRKYCWYNLFLLLTDFNNPLEIQGFVILVNSVPLIHSSQVLLPIGFHYKTLQGFTQVTRSKGTQTIWKAGEWNEELESDVWSEHPPEISTKHDNKGQSYKSVCGRLSVQP